MESNRAVGQGEGDVNDLNWVYTFSGASITVIIVASGIVEAEFQLASFEYPEHWNIKLSKVKRSIC
jgi:hypothetical protein